MTREYKRKVVNSLRFILFNASNSDLSKYRKRTLLIDVLYVLANSNKLKLDDFKSIERLLMYEINKRSDLK